MRSRSRPSPIRRPFSAATALLVVLVSLLYGVVPATAQAARPSALAADTSGFKGVNWARIGDNFSSGPLVPQGLNLTDSYSTVQTKANAMLTAFASLGANTVRLPVNPAPRPTPTPRSARTGGIPTPR